MVVNMTTSLGDLIDLVAAREAAASGNGRSAREVSGISQTELAAMIGVAPSTVSRWESSERAPSGSSALRWIRALRAIAPEALR